MRTSYLVCYDICDDKRLRKVFQTMRGLRGPSCSIRSSNASLRRRTWRDAGPNCRTIINHKEDQVLFVNLGPAEGRGDRVITALGKPYTALDAPCIIV